MKKIYEELGIGTLVYKLLIIIHLEKCLKIIDQNILLRLSGYGGQARK